MTPSTRHSKPSRSELGSHAEHRKNIWDRYCTSLAAPCTAASALFSQQKHLNSANLIQSTLRRRISRMPSCTSLCPAKSSHGSHGTLMFRLARSLAVERVQKDPDPRQLDRSRRLNQCRPNRPLSKFGPRSRHPSPGFLIRQCASVFCD